MLTNRQIERYSRQIIAQGFGGSAQEHLLAARIAVIGALEDIDPILAYLVGAGVGHINLCTDVDADALAALAARFRGANPDVAMTTNGEDGGTYNLLLGFARNQAGTAQIHAAAARHPNAAVVYARLDSSPIIAAIPKRPPCLSCAGTDLNAPFAGPSEHPGLVAMAAGLEAIKILARIAPAETMLIKFVGYAASASPIGQRPDRTACECTPVTPR